MSIAAVYRRTDYWILTVKGPSLRKGGHLVPPESHFHPSLFFSAGPCFFKKELKKALVVLREEGGSGNPAMGKLHCHYAISAATGKPCKPVPVWENT